MNRVSAVFDDLRDAEKAVNWQREKGVPNENISVLARTPSETEKIAEREGVQRVAKDAGSDVARGAGTGLPAGAAVGAIFGLAVRTPPGL